MGLLLIFAVCIIVAFCARWYAATSIPQTSVRGDALFVFAHPDDEAMFFSPIIYSLSQQGITCHFLCLSNGNFNGLGETREHELYASAEYLGLRKRNVKVVNHPELQDGIHEGWSPSLIMKLVDSYLAKAMQISTIITFDEHGISSHPNHIAVHQGVKKLKNSMPPGLIFLQLKTRNVISKYMSVASLVLPLALPGGRDRRRFSVIVPPTGALTSYNAMKRHKSQLKIRFQRMGPKPFQPPSNWRVLLRHLEEYRKVLAAPVDTIGCHCLLDPRARKPIQRFQTLIALMLSAQTKDEVTAQAMHQLIGVGLTAENIARMPEKKLNEYIEKVGFHNNKAKYIKSVAEILIEKYNGTPPTTYDELVALPGVGPKMAHLFLQAADNIVAGIGVDTHVHRISKRFQWVPKTVKGPEETRKVLESWLPKGHWGTINSLLVGLGQTVCTPLRPCCSECHLQDCCPNAFKESPRISSFVTSTKRSREEDLEDTIARPPKKQRSDKIKKMAVKTLMDLKKEK